MNIDRLFRNNIKSKSIAYALLSNIALSYITLFICRAIFITANYSQYSAAFANNDIWTMAKGAFMFDTSAVCYMNIAYIALLLFPLHYKEGAIMQKITEYLFIVPNAPFKE